MKASDGVLFNDSWRFSKGDMPNAESICFNDNNWRLLDLPHDWAIEGPFDSKYNARCGGLPFHGIGWYRKTFNAESTWKNKIVRLTFDGAMNEAKIFVNGKLVTEHPYGYTSFDVDITSFLKLGQKNVVAVKLSPRDLSARWYPGAGLYRNVWLQIDEPVHVGQWGVTVTTPTATDWKAVVQIQTKLDNVNKESGQYKIVHEIIDNSGKIASTVSGNVEFNKENSKSNLVYANLMKPKLWSIDTPQLYNLVTKVYSGDKLLDTYKTKFGIRHISFTKEGFFLNDKKVRLNGVCLHHDNGPIGAALNVSADKRKLQIMKQMGCNAIRTSHNPPSPEFLDLCDELGFVVIDEAFDEWVLPKIPNGYSNFFKDWAEKDLIGMIRRDVIIRVL